MANNLTTRTDARLPRHSQPDPSLPQPRASLTDDGYRATPKDALEQKIEETFIRGSETVAAGEKTASIGKTVALCALAVAAAPVIIAGGVIAIGTGSVVGGLLTLAAAGAGIVGMKALTNAAVGIGFGKTVRGVGVMRQRAGNSAMARCLSACADYAYYKTNHRHEAENLNALRHAVSNRGEFFYPIAGQPQIETEVIKVNQNLDQVRSESIGVYVGGTIKAFRDMFTNPVGEAAQLIKAARKN